MGGVGMASCASFGDRLDREVIWIQKQGWKMTGGIYKDDGRWIIRAKGGDSREQDFRLIRGRAQGFEEGGKLHDDLSG